MVKASKHPWSRNEALVETRPIRNLVTERSPSRRSGTVTERSPSRRNIPGILMDAGRRAKHSGHGTKQCRAKGSPSKSSRHTQDFIPVCFPVHCLAKGKEEREGETRLRRPRNHPQAPRGAHGALSDVHWLFGSLLPSTLARKEEREGERERDTTVHKERERDTLKIPPHVPKRVQTVRDRCPTLLRIP